MSESLRIGWSQLQALAARDVYRRLLALNLVLQAALGLAALAVPDRLSSLLGLGAGATDWLRVWGFWQLAAIFFYAPGWFDPVYRRWTNMLGIPLRLASAVLFALLGFYWLALFDAGFALVLAIAYSRMIRAELMSRP